MMCGAGFVRRCAISHIFTGFRRTNYGTSAWTLIYELERVWPWLRRPIAAVTVGAQRGIA